MSPDYDAPREIDRLESRFNREMDRRFAEVNEKLLELKKQMESIETKLDVGKDKAEDRLYERSTWTVRQIVTIIAAFIMGGGALGVIQTIVHALWR